MVNKIQNKQKDTRLFFTLLKTVWIGLFMCAFFYSVQLGMKIQDRNLIYSYNTVLSNDQDANIPTTVDANFLKASPAGIIPNSSSSQPALNLIDDRELELNDYFSDSFLLTKENFLKIPLKQVGIVEDACFAAIGKGRRNPNSKMFTDWTEFSVEHMSKWWSQLRILNDRDDGMFQRTISIFDDYLKKISKFREESPLYQTIAVIAFAPYKPKGRGGHMDRGKRLTTYSLAATIASLYRVGFGRVVVIGYNEDDNTWVDDAFKLLGSIFNNQENVVAFKIGDTELNYIHITDESWVKTKYVARNMPLAAILGLRKALTGDLDEPDRKRWLGSKDASHWKYVYLTEPDTLLQTKPSMLSPIRDGLEQGLSFFPHRLQPLPHEINLPKNLSAETQGSYLPNIHPFSNITVWDTWNNGETMHCCDDGKGWPGRTKEFGERLMPCGSWWYMCGFKRKGIVKELQDAVILENNKRLLSYPMMKLRDGTGVVFASTEMGRRCIPSKTPCKNRIS